jgi:ribosome-associated toxin RatA of RatAB toxin-antitoxin module
MPIITSTAWIKAPLSKVYAIAKDNESFPSYMKDVESLTVVESDGSRVVSDYVGVVSAFNLKVRWQQEDLWDEKEGTCRFRQLKGDYDTFEGVWTLTEKEGGCQFDSEINYEYRVPGLGLMVGAVIKGLVQKNSDAVLEAIKAKAEGSAEG